MNSENRIKLKRIIADEFAAGINKKSLFEAMELFIEQHYREKTNVTIRGLKKSEEINKFGAELVDSGGYKQWKQNLMRQIRAGIVSDVLKESKARQG